MPITVLGEKDPNSLLKDIANIENIELPTQHKTELLTHHKTELPSQHNPPLPAEIQFTADREVENDNLNNGEGT